MSPGIDGITGFLVRRHNLTRMGLVRDEVSGTAPLPFKAFPKKAVLQEIAKRGKDSDWTDHKAIIKVRKSLRAWVYNLRQRIALAPWLEVASVPL